MAETKGAPEGGGRGLFLEALAFNELLSDPPAQRPPQRPPLPQPPAQPPVQLPAQPQTPVQPPVQPHEPPQQPPPAEQGGGNPKCCVCWESDVADMQRLNCGHFICLADLKQMLQSSGCANACPGEWTWERERPTSIPMR